jgi:cytochrome c
MTRITCLSVFALSLSVFAYGMAPASADDLAQGEQVFKKCQICHSIGPGAKNKVGPELNGLDGRHSGSVAGYDYSAANTNSGIVWNEQTFKQYIRDPRGMVPGTKMTFAGLKDDQQAASLWLYVSQFASDGTRK